MVDVLAAAATRLSQPEMFWFSYVSQEQNVSSFCLGRTKSSEPDQTCCLDKALFRSTVN